MREKYDNFPIKIKDRKKISDRRQTSTLFLCMYAIAHANNKSNLEAFDI